MIVEALKRVEVEFDALLVQWPYEDGLGPEDQCPLPEQFRSGDKWNLGIDIDTGRVINWPEGTTVDLYEKVVDSGRYTLLRNGKEVAVRDDNYVPDVFPRPHYGDYLILKIGPDGIIADWKNEATAHNFAEAFFEGEKD